MQSFYVDTCVYLNLWKKETDEKNRPLWKFAKDFLDIAFQNKTKIVYSGFILKELLFILSTEEYLSKKEIFEDNKLFEKAILSEKEYSTAIEMKNKNKFNCSLFDIIHTLIAKKTNAILITRDEDLIVFARSLSVTAKKPEEIINY